MKYRLYLWLPCGNDTLTSKPKWILELLVSCEWAPLLSKRIGGFLGDLVICSSLNLQTEIENNS